MSTNSPVSWLRPAPSVEAQSTTSNPQAVIAFNPPSIAGLGITSGTVTFTLTVTNSTPITGFAISLQYNTAVLQAVSPVNFAGNVLGINAQVQEECIDGHLVIGICQPTDTPGVVTLNMFTQGQNVTPANTTGTLFQVSFSVISAGFSQLHIFSQVLSNGVTGIQVPAITIDGYFTNLDCPKNSGVLCKPPLASFTFTPSRPSSGSAVSFNASASRSLNLGPPVANISQYNWVFGDGSIGQTSLIPLTQHAYRGTCNCSVTLSVKDTYGITASITIIVRVTQFFVDLTVGGIVVNPQYNVIPGIAVKISIVVVNNSTVAENGTLTVKLEDGRVLSANQSYRLGPFRQQTTISTAWDTTGYTPRVYRVDAIIPPVENITSNRVIENITSNNIASAYIQLISPLLSGLLSLNLLQSTGLAIIVLVGVGFAASRLLRKPSFEEEDLSVPK